MRDFTHLTCHFIYLFFLVLEEANKLATRKRNAHTAPAHKHRFSIRDACKDFIVSSGICALLKHFCCFFFMFCKSFACCILLTPCIKYSQKPHKSFFADFVTSALDVRMCKQFYFALNTVWRHCRQLSRGNLLNNLTHKKHANSAQSTACYGNQTTCCGLFVILSTAVTTDGGISPRLWCL